MSRKSSRVKTRIDYNEGTLAGGRRVLFSVHGHGLICESETTEVRGSNNIKLAMPRALRDWNENEEVSKPRKDRDNSDDEDEVIHEKEDKEPSNESILVRLRAGIARSLDLSARGSGMHVSSTATSQDEDPEKEERRLSTFVILLLIIFNSLVFSLAVVVLTDSKDAVASTFLSGLERLNMGIGSGHNLTSRRELFSTIREMKLERLKKQEERTRTAVRAALRDVSRFESEEFDVEDVIKDVSELLAADRGLGPDFALISAGATVLASSPSALTRLRSYMLERVDFITSRKADGLTAYPNSPASALEGNLLPGECWAFPGDKANVTIKLARRAKIKMLAIEHAPASTVPSVNSAPKDFRVVAFNQDLTETLLGEFKYNASTGVSHQSFKLEDPHTTRIVRLEILSNHGADYTCVYRFRVHGTSAS